MKFLKENIIFVISSLLLAGFLVIIYWPQKVSVLNYSTTPEISSVVSPSPSASIRPRIQIRGDDDEDDD